MSRRALVFIVLTSLCVLLGAGYVAQSVRQAQALDATETAVHFSSLPRATASQVDVLARKADPKNSQTTDPAVSLLTVKDGKTTSVSTGVRCRRVYFAADRGLCLIEDRTGLNYKALVLDRNMKTLESFVLTGIPSRARVSASGHWGSVTTFSAGHSYANPGQFSTQTQIIDMKAGKPIADLEHFKLYRDGKRIDAPDINLWGVTFADDDDTFYATLRTGGSTYLIKGSVSARTANTMRTNVECPSLSPDGTRIAYKKNVGGNGNWRIHVLTLADMSDRQVADANIVDDQVEWLDNQHVLYARDGKVWQANDDGTGKATVFASGVESPSVIRGAGDQGL